MFSLVLIVNYIKEPSTVWAALSGVKGDAQYKNEKAVSDSNQASKDLFFSFDFLCDGLTLCSCFAFPLLIDSHYNLSQSFSPVSCLLSEWFLVKELKLEN